MPPVHVTSEVGPLSAVLVHAPGPELAAVTPGNRAAYLFDDIIDQERAEREHRMFRQVLARFAEVLEVRRLVTELLVQREIRELLVARALQGSSAGGLARELAGLEPGELASRLIEGAHGEAGPLARALNEAPYALPPLPNLFFTRDAGVVIDEHAVVGAMRYGVRWTEELLVKALFRYHPALANAGLLYDGSEEQRSSHTLEGGDVHPLRPDLLVTGFSERSSAAALDLLCELVFAQTAVTDVIVVVLPTERAAVHLDMIFTQIDRELCCVYPPHFVGPERLAVLHRHKGSAAVRDMPTFFAALEAVGQPLEPVFCGGMSRSLQDREQWSSACNFFAVRPGVVLTYARNEATIAELRTVGFRELAAADVVTGDVPEGRAVITLDASELVRGGGGPRCMTLPLRREEL